MTDVHDQSPLFELPRQYVELHEQAKDLAESVSGIAARADEADDIDPEMRAALGDSGLAGIQVPAEYGGRFDRVDALAVTVVREALAAESAHLDSLLGLQGIGSYAISVGGGEALAREWLPRVARLDAIASLGLTEPHVGSDLKALSTTITEERGELVISGHKTFITNAGDADFCCVLGREGDGYSLVFVPMDTPGVSTSKPNQIIASHVLGDVVLDGARVPVENRLGESGKGFKMVLSTLATFRVSVAGAAVGMAEAGLVEAVRHANRREQFGVSLGRLGSVPERLATSWTEIEMARALTYRAAAAATSDPAGNLHLSSMAKVGATEVAGRVIDRSLQTMGRFGLTRGSKIERLYREARPMRIYEGATEVVLDSLAKQLIKRTT